MAVGTEVELKIVAVAMETTRNLLQPLFSMFSDWEGERYSIAAHGRSTATTQARFRGDSQSLEKLVLAIVETPDIACSLGS